MVVEPTPVGEATPELLMMAIDELAELHETETLPVVPSEKVAEAENCSV